MCWLHRYHDDVSNRLKKADLQIHWNLQEVLPTYLPDGRTIEELMYFE